MARLGSRCPLWSAPIPDGTLCTPLVDRDMAEEAVTGILGGRPGRPRHALIFRATSLDGAAMKALPTCSGREGMAPLVLQSHVRACLDATCDADEMLRDALGAKKLKELRRQRNRSPNTAPSILTWRARLLK